MCSDAVCGHVASCAWWQDCVLTATGLMLSSKLPAIFYRRIVLGASFLLHCDFVCEFTVLLYNCWPRGPRHVGLTSNDDMRGNTGHSSVGRAPNCRRAQQSDAPWCGSALPAIWDPMSHCESKLAKHRAHPDLNQGPADLRSAALTTELCTRVRNRTHNNNMRSVTPILFPTNYFID